MSILTDIKDIKWTPLDPGEPDFEATIDGKPPLSARVADFGHTWCVVIYVDRHHETGLPRVLYVDHFGTKEAAMRRAELALTLAVSLRGEL